MSAGPSAGRSQPPTGIVANAVFSIVAALALLAAVGSAPAPASADDRFALALQLFEQRRFRVLVDHPRCAAQGLFGFHVRGTATVVVCPRGNRLESLLHEGWHAVQSLCLRQRPWLPPEEVERRLGRRDRRDLERLYAPARRPAESEARLMAALPLERYSDELDRACGYRP